MDDKTQRDKPDVVLELNFVPTWAREPPGQNPYAHFEGSEGDRRHGRRPREAFKEGPGRGRDRKKVAFPAKQGERRFEQPQRAPREIREQRYPSAHPAPERLPIEISFVPERNRLGALVRDLRASCRAYPLIELASRFLANPAFYLVKFEARHAGDQDKPVRLYQCRECKILFLDKSELIAHTKNAHLNAYFTVEQLAVEPPTGNFTCVARCKLSGTLLGPPNYHSYNEQVQEVRRARFPQMSLDEYRSHIETVHDPELIEKWKRESCTQTIYHFKNQESAQPMKYAEAEKHFLTRCAAGMAVESNRFIIPADVARHLVDSRLKFALREAWARESRRPFSLMLALRPAFHHMHLHLFKTNGGVTFVTAVQPHAINPAQTVKPIAEVLRYLREHPGCTRQQMVEGLCPGKATDSAEVAAALSPLRWLTEKGHVIEFFNGTLSVPGGGGGKHAPSHVKENVKNTPTPEV